MSQPTASTRAEYRLSADKNPEREQALKFARDVGQTVVEDWLGTKKHFWMRIVRVPHSPMINTGRRLTDHGIEDAALLGYFASLRWLGSWVPGR